jgi:hypothetical protein
MVVDGIELPYQKSLVGVDSVDDKNIKCGRLTLERVVEFKCECDSYCIFTPTLHQVV